MLWMLLACRDPEAVDSDPVLPPDTDVEVVHQGSWRAADAVTLLEGPPNLQFFLSAIPAGDLDLDGSEDLIATSLTPFGETQVFRVYGPLLTAPRSELVVQLSGAFEVAAYDGAQLWLNGPGVARVPVDDGRPEVLRPRTAVGQVVPVGDWDGDGVGDVVAAFDTRLCVLPGTFTHFDLSGDVALATIAGIRPRAAVWNGELFVGDPSVNGGSGAVMSFPMPFEGVPAPQMRVVGGSASGLGTSVALADADADGDVDIVTAGELGALFAFTMDGELLREGIRVEQVWDVEIATGIVDDDDVIDVMYGEEVFSGPLSGPEWPVGKLSVVDVEYARFAAWVDADGDGDLEPVVAAIRTEGSYLGVLDP